MLTRLGIGVLAAALAVPASSSARAQDPGAGDICPVGAAAVDITPDHAVRLSGYGGRRAESDGVAQRIWARAIAIGGDRGGGSDGGDGPALLVGVENCAVPAALTERLAARLFERAGIARERLVVAATHTHTAPMLTGALPNLFSEPIPPEHQQRIDRYTEGLLSKLERVALAALAARQPCRLAFGRARVGFAINRRTPGGPIEHDLPVLRAVDANGELCAVLGSYACHCTTLGGDFNQVCGDWAGFAMEDLEARHAGAVAVVTAGCGGDQNPAPRHGIELARQHGLALAQEVARVLDGPLLPVRGPLRAKLERLALPFDAIPSRAELEARAGQGGPVGYHARVQLARLDRGEALRTTLPYPVGTWSFGEELAIVFLGGEVVVDYALRIRRELDPGRLWVMAYCNDVACYIPSERVLQEGGYEGGDAMVYYDQPTKLAPGLEQTIVASVHRQLGRLFDLPAGVDPERTDGTAPRSPERSRASMKLADRGLRVELAASEPLVQDPVAIDFGTDGRLWVCEMGDYPSGLGADGAPGGRIRCLFDRDGDGRFDEATTFLDGLPFPTDVKVWRDGVLVCAAPDILYAEDRDGDGVADRREVLFTGFATHNFQARVNSLTWGLDNLVHGAGGLFGGRVRSTRTGAVVAADNQDFRLDPDRGTFEGAAGRAQQGRRRDDEGDWFGCDNSNLCFHYPLAAHYLARNAVLAGAPPQTTVPRGPDPNRLFPLSLAPPRYNRPEDQGRVTSACGLEVYRGELLGEGCRGDVFVCEPVAGVVCRLELEGVGTTFYGERSPGERDREFLASTDPWSRPVQVRTGTDGALWVVDMYRFLIEHPRFVPPERLRAIDERAGAGRGRIYRVVPNGAAPRALPRLDGSSAEQLARAIDSPNGALRDLAAQMLYWRGDRSAVPVLEELARGATRPEVRLQALCALDGLGALPSATCLAALADPHPALRRHAVRLCEPRLGGDDAMLAALLPLAGDEDSKVRLQLACTLGSTDDAAAGRALARLMLRDAGDPRAVAAVLSSAPAHADTLALELIEDDPPRSIALRHRLLRQLWPTVERYGSKASRLAEWFVELGGAVPAGERFDAVRLVLPSLHGTKGASVDGVLDDAGAVARDRAASLDDRCAAVALLGEAAASGLGVERVALQDLLSARYPAPLQVAVVEALGRCSGDLAVPGLLLDGWAGHGPGLRAAILAVLQSRAPWARALLDRAAVAADILASLDPTRRQALRDHADPSVRARAEAVLGVGPGEPGVRSEIVEHYRPVAARGGDAGRGALVFGKVCSACHRLDGAGNDIGPDLARLSDRSADALLVAILDPNRAVADSDVQYVVRTRDGRALAGRIEAETQNGVTLRAADGARHAVLRGDILELHSTGRSLMPDGLEALVAPPDMADLIAYLQREHAPPKAFPGNEPTLIEPDADGALGLLATRCAVYGDEIRFEPQFQNLGYWHGRGDRAVWTVELPRSGTFDVVLDWACADAVAGDRFALEGGREPVRGTIAPTGGWDRYRQARVGVIALAAGRSRLTFRADGDVHGALCDLRGIRLVPVR